MQLIASENAQMLYDTHDFQFAESLKLSVRSGQDRFTSFWVYLQGC